LDEQRIHPIVRFLLFGIFKTFHVVHILALIRCYLFRGEINCRWLPISEENCGKALSKKQTMPNQLPQLKISSTPEIDLEEAELIKLHAQWEEHMKDLSPQRRYTRVAVLLLYWDKAGDNAEASYLDTSEEVTELN
jgi:hypothetical protein